MKTKTTNLALLILSLIPLALVALLYPQLPDQVPINWGLGGVVEYSGKATLWLLAGLSPLLAILLRALPKIDPRKKNYQKFAGYYDAFCLVMLLFLLLMLGVTLSESMAPGRLSVWRIICCALGLLFAFLGNFLPKVKSNFFLGVKTPWTLSDADVWNRTHRLGGQLFFWFGLLLMAAGFLLPEIGAFFLMFGGTLAIVILILVLSYCWYRNRHPENNS